jgi:hypothetical protein
MTPRRCQTERMRHPGKVQVEVSDPPDVADAGTQTVGSGRCIRSISSVPRSVLVEARRKRAG